MINLDVVVLNFLGIVVGSVRSNPPVAVGVGDDLPSRFFRRSLEMRIYFKSVTFILW